MAGAVIFRHPNEVISSGTADDLLEAISYLKDSKLLSALIREKLLPAIESLALATGVGIVSPGLVDVIGVGPANRLAMSRAVRDLGVWPDFLLLDAFRVPSMPIPQRPIVKGDATCMSIAAASIVAFLPLIWMYYNSPNCLRRLGKRYFWWCLVPPSV